MTTTWLIVGDANVIQQCLKAGLIDELQISISPVLLGDGLRLFEHLENENIQLEKVKSQSIRIAGR
ncbi:MAG: dihydrofolate reductase family protein [Chloroflexota bacterium]